MASEKWMIREEELDDDQYRIKNLNPNLSYIIEGCAGSGKTVLALWRAREIQESSNGGDFYVIVFTRALRRFIEDGVREIGLENTRIVYENQWTKRLGSPNSDYIIVDEVQDFSIEKIQTFVQRSRKSTFFFGDTAQSIYEEGSSIGKIADVTRFSLRSLNNNYRLPKKIAKIAERLMSVQDDLVSRCQKEGSELPNIVKFSTREEELNFIISQIQSRGLTDSAILIATNQLVEYVSDYLDQKGIDNEVKLYLSGNKNIENLDFSSDNPKIMTYHSSKGLQFYDVFLPFCDNETVASEFYRNPLYVAFTRAINSITVTYSGVMSHFFQSIPSDLYNETVRDITTQDTEKEPDVPF